VDREWLREELASGRAIESIARELDRDASTVSYWVHKHGLASSHAERHAARGGIERELREDLVAEGLSIRAAAQAPPALVVTSAHEIGRAVPGAFAGRDSRIVRPREGPRRPEPVLSQPVAHRRRHAKRRANVCCYAPTATPRSREALLGYPSL
jgi:hypothetical protein